MYPGTRLAVGFSEVTDSLPKNLCLPLSRPEEDTSPCTSMLLSQGNSILTGSNQNMYC